MCNSYSIVWEILAAIYNLLLIFCISWQAGHVSQMKFTNLALEGDVSLQALPLLVTVSMFGTIVQVVFEYGSEDHLAVVIVQTIWNMLFPTVIIATTFLPKVSSGC